MKRTELTKFDSLPLGARFRYPGKQEVFVKIEARGIHQCGVVAEWGTDLDWIGQGIYTYEESAEARAAGQVEWLDKKDDVPSVESRTLQPKTPKLAMENALREAVRCRSYPDPVLNEQVIVVLADEVLRLRLKK